MVRLEDLKLVDVILWKFADALVVTPSRWPLTRTTNSAEGGASNSTKKLPLSCGFTTPSISSDPSSLTRETSVSVMESFPDTVSNKLTLTPFKEKQSWLSLTRRRRFSPRIWHLNSLHYRIWDAFQGQQKPRLDPVTSPQSQTGSQECSHLQTPK